MENEGPLPRYQELMAQSPDAYFSADRPPRLVLFVSHRWLSRSCPDPEGQTAAIMRRFLGWVLDALVAARKPAAERLQLLPSIARHGVFQAAWLAGCTRGFGEDDESGFRQFVEEASASSDDARARLLEGIGLWFDYSCLPQTDGAAGSQRTAEELALLSASLRRLPALIAASAVLVLRAEGDDYGGRGWCAMELAVGRPGRRHFLVRTDLLDTPILEAELLGTGLREGTAFPDARQGLFKTMNEWASKKDGTWILRAVETEAFMGLDELEEERETPLFITPRAPNIFPGQLALLTSMADALGRLDQVDRLLGDGRLMNADVAELVAGAMAAAGLTCTEPRDVLYVGLALLYARHVGAPEFAEFYARCIARQQSGQTLKLQRLRRYQNMHTNRLWAVFEGEPDDSPYVDMPAWAAHGG